MTNSQAALDSRSIADWARRGSDITASPSEVVLKLVGHEVAVPA